MATGAAPNDPLFFAFHVFFNRVLHYGRLNQPFLDGLDWTWDSETCTGSSLYDNLPFSDLFESEPHKEMYTNAELWDLLDPSKDILPYMYDDLTTFGSCSLTD